MTTAEQHVWQSLLAQIEVLIKQANAMHNDHSLPRAHLICGLHEIRDVAKRELAAAHVGEVV